MFAQPTHRARARFTAHADSFARPMNALSFLTPRPEKMRTSDLAEFRAQIRSALLDSYTDERAFIKDHFGDIRFNQTHDAAEHKEPVLVITLTPSAREAQRLIGWIALTMEERFLFQGHYVSILRN